MSAAEHMREAASAVLLDCSHATKHTNNSWTAHKLMLSTTLRTQRHICKHLAHLYVLDTQPLHNAGREHPAGKCAPEDGIKLPVQAANAQRLKVERLGLEELRGGKALLAQDLDAVGVCFAAVQSGSRHAADPVSVRVGTG
jgi:hypothetical protein